MKDMTKSELQTKLAHARKDSESIDAMYASLQTINKDLMRSNKELTMVVGALQKRNEELLQMSLNMAYALRRVASPPQT